MNTLTEDDLKELARKASKNAVGPSEQNERRDLMRAVVTHFGVEKIPQTPVKHWPLLQAMFEHWIKADNPLLTVTADAKVDEIKWAEEGTLAELKVKQGDVVEYLSGGSNNPDNRGEGEQGTVDSKLSVWLPGPGYPREFTYSYDAKFRIISRAAETKADSFLAMPEPQPEETPLDHFGQPANEKHGVPQTSKDAYAEIARSLGHAVIAHVEAGEYEQALKCAAMMRRAEMVRNPIVHSPEGKPYFILGERQFSGSAAMSKDDPA